MKKRRNGEGSTYRTPRGWFASASYRKPDGTPGRQKRGPFGTADEADVARLQLVLRHRTGTTLAPVEDRSLRDYLRLWLHDLAAERRPATQESYRYHIELNIIPAIGAVLLRDLDVQHVRHLLRTVEAQGLGPVSTGGVRKVLHAAIEQARRDRLVPENVVALVPAPRAPVGERPVLSEAQATKLRKHVADDRLGALYVIASTLGLRQGELLGLTWPDVDLEAAPPRLTVRRQLQYHARRYQLVDLKTSRSRRTIALPEVVTAALGAHRTRQATEREQCGATYGTHGLVFATRQGEPIHKRNLVRAFKRHLREAELPDIRFHDLRHTAASFLLARGGDPATVQGVLGHASLSMTMERYRHLSLEAQTELMKRVDERFSSSVAPSVAPQPAPVLRVAP